MIALNFNADRGREVQEYIFNVSPKIKIKDRKGSFAEGYRKWDRYYWAFGEYLNDCHESYRDELSKVMILNVFKALDMLQSFFKLVASSRPPLIKLQGGSY